MSEGIDPAESNNSKEYMTLHYRFINYGNGCHDL